MLREQEQFKKQITELENALNDNSITNAFNSQKTKYQKIVQDCQELLAELREE